jgi:hypothetical protein
VRQLEELVAGARPGDSPSTPRDPAARRHVLRFEVAAETFAIFREALSQLRRRSDTRLDDDALLLMLARTALGGPCDEGRSSYQVSLNVCAECGRGAQLASGELVAVGPEIVELAQCDGQVLASSAPAANDIPNPSSAEPSRRTPSQCAPVGAHAHAGQVIADDHDIPSRPRAKQTVPPALRRTVLQRDRRRCRVPGCTHATFVDVHHIQPRCEGGRNEAGNLITLCGAHHRSAHRGELIIEGTSADQVRFRHADGSCYGDVASPRASQTHSKVFAALRHLGFREVEVRAVLVDMARQSEARDATAEWLLREALRWLTARAC